MKRLIKRIFGIDELIEESRKTNKLLERLIVELEYNSSLQLKMNKHYHVK